MTDNTAIYNKLFSLYIKFGATPEQAKLILSQNMLETNNFTSQLFLTHNNIGGVMYIGQQGATKGTTPPSSEKNPMHYAKFDSIESSALAVWNTVKKAVQNSTDTTTYAAQLKLHGYYAAPEKDYSNLLNIFYKKLNGFKFSNVAVISTTIIVIFAIVFFFSI